MINTKKTKLMEQFEEETGDESLKVVQGDYADEYYYTEEYAKYLERLLMETHESVEMWTNNRRKKQ